MSDIPYVILIDNNIVGYVNTRQEALIQLKEFHTQAKGVFKENAFFEYETDYIGFPENSNINPQITIYKIYNLWLFTYKVVYYTIHAKAVNYLY